MSKKSIKIFFNIIFILYSKHTISNRCQCFVTYFVGPPPKWHNISFRKLLLHPSSTSTSTASGQLGVLTRWRISKFENFEIAIKPKSLILTLSRWWTSTKLVTFCIANEWKNLSQLYSAAKHWTIFKIVKFFAWIEE